MEFDVIQHIQTPITPEVKNVYSFIEENKEKLLALQKYADEAYNCIGLAANQCSIDGKRFNVRAVIIKDVITKQSEIIINPVITKLYGIEREKAEGCLTWGQKDGRYFTIIAKRFHFVDVEYYTMDGEKRSETFKGFQGQVWQHEVNHINGVEENVTAERYELEVPIDTNTERNAICPCGSGKKHKKCCIEN